MARRTVEVAVIIPDASPILTLARVDRLDLFERIIGDGPELIEEINARRKSPMLPIERPGRTRRFQSKWLRKPRNDPG